jgi:hypothetical protein
VPANVRRVVKGVFPPDRLFGPCAPALGGLLVLESNLSPAGTVCVIVRGGRIFRARAQNSREVLITGRIARRCTR